MIFFVNDSFMRFNLNGYLTKSNFGVSSVKFAHNTFSTFGIAGYNTNGIFKVNVLQVSF